MRLPKAAWVLALAVLPGYAAGAAADVDADVDESIPAIWKSAKIEFTYIGRTSFYSCSSIEYKVERILKAVGARDDIDVRASGCSLLEPDRFMTVRIKLAVPSVLTPGAGLDREEKSRRELVARVRGETAAELELEQQFPAEWKRVTFSRRSRFIDDGDCELLEQLQHQVFTKLDIRIVREDNWCIPGQITFGQMNMEVETLVALPKPDEAG